MLAYRYLSLPSSNDALSFKNHLEQLISLFTWSYLKKTLSRCLFLILIVPVAFPRKANILGVYKLHVCLDLTFIPVVSQPFFTLTCDAMPWTGISPTKYISLHLLCPVSDPLAFVFTSYIFLLLLSLSNLRHSETDDISAHPQPQLFLVIRFPVHFLAWPTFHCFLFP